MWLLCSERASSCLCVKAKHHGFFIGGSQLLHRLCPHPSCRAKLCYFLKQIIVRIEEEGETLAKNITIQTFFKRCFYIGFSISQRERYFLYCRTACLTDMVARN